MKSIAAAAELALRNGDPQTALVELQNEVRAHAEDPHLRVFLFQLLAVLGQWDRALNQLNVAAELDPINLAMAQTYREAISCEVLRQRVFAGQTSPMVFGEPAQWLALLIESLLCAGRGQVEESVRLQAQAFEQAPASSGRLDGVPFDWIADADSRLGPVLEAIVNGRYYWIPFARLSLIDIDPPEDLRDVVWLPAHLRFSNGGESVALIPTRYPGSTASGDGAILLARRTEWRQITPECYHGLGQRILSTMAGDKPLMDIRLVQLDSNETDNG